MDDIFEIHDFTCITRWSRFRASIEAVIHKWHLVQFDIPERSNEKVDLSDADWKVKQDSLKFEPYSFDIAHYEVDIKTKPLNQHNTRNQDKTNYGFLMEAMLDLMDSKPDFVTVKSAGHILSNFYGLKDILVIKPSDESPDLIDESMQHTVLSAIYVATCETGCDKPVFVQINDKRRNMFLGVCQNSWLRTCFDSIHLKTTPAKCGHLTGILDLFKEKVASPLQMTPPVKVSARLTFDLQEPLDDSHWAHQESMDHFSDDSVEKLKRIIQKQHFSLLPFGAIEDPLQEFMLYCSWHGLNEDTLVENDVYSDLDPLLAPRWSVSAKFSSECACLMSVFLAEYMKLTACHKSIDSVLGSSVGNIADLTVPLDRLASSTLSADVARLTASLSGNAAVASNSQSSSSFASLLPNFGAGSSHSASKTPLFDDDILNGMLTYLFPDSAVDQSKTSVDQSKASFDQSKESVDQSKASVDQSKTSVNQSKTSIDQSKTSIDQSKTSIDQSKMSVGESNQSLDQSWSTLDQSNSAINELTGLIDNRSITGDVNVTAAPTKSRDPIDKSVKAPGSVLKIYKHRKSDSSVAAGLEKEQKDELDYLLQNCLNQSKIAPKNSLTTRLALLLCQLSNSMQSESAFSYIWREFLMELRYRFECGIRIPGLENAAPALSTSLLNQKMQMLNCCVERKLARLGQSKCKLPVDPCASSLIDSSAENDESFFDCVEETSALVDLSVNNAEGRLRPLDGVTTLLRNKNELLYIPKTQDPAPFTEDMLEEHTHSLLELGTSEEAALLRTKLQCQSLISDIEAFKAANPDCCFEDFLKWYSPKDLVERVDDSGDVHYSLSYRMSVSNNLWVESWNSAKPKPVNKQKRLFDETKEAEKILHWLESLKISEIVRLTLAPLFSVALCQLWDESRPVRHLVRENLAKIANAFPAISRTTNFVDYDDFRKSLERVEATVSSYRTLRNRFFSYVYSSEDPDDPTEEQISPDDLDAFVLSMLNGSEVKVVGGSRSALNRAIAKLFATDVRVKSDSNDKSCSSFPPAYRKEYVLRLFVPRPSNASRDCVQRLYVSIKEDEFRAAGAFSDDIQFF